MSSISIGLDQTQLLGVANLLRQTLADEFILYTKTRKYHWNVEGPHFHDLHKFFESQYEKIDEMIDDVAERIRALGLYSSGSLSEFLKDARIKDDAGGQIGSVEMIENLLEDHEAIIRSLRVDLATAMESYGDAGNQDFLTGLLESHEKAAWMLRSLLR